MELVVAHFIDPVATMIILKCENRPVCLAQIPDSHSSVSAARSHSVKLTLIIGQIKDLVNMGSEVHIAGLSIRTLLAAKIENTDRVFESHGD